METIPAWVNAGGLITVVVFLLTIIRWGISRKWVFGWVYEAALKERDEYKQISFDLLRVAERSATAGEQIVLEVKRKETGT